eukprot:4480730-Pyramimonas_sp.AAC.1
MASHGIPGTSHIVQTAPRRQHPVVCAAPLRGVHALVRVRGPDRSSFLPARAWLDRESASGGDV